MKKHLLLTLFLLSAVILAAQSKVDTLYYDKEGLKAEHPAFAEFYRIALHKENGGKYRDFSARENRLLAEGEFLKIDPEDDSKTLFNGKNVMYDFYGNIASETNFIDGKLFGASIEYYPDGEIKSKGMYADGLRNGTFIYYSEDGRVSTYEEYQDGQSLHNYYTLNSNNYLSKYDYETGEQIFDEPQIEDMVTETINGRKYYTFKINGLHFVANLSQEQTKVGKYLKLSLMLANYSQYPVNFNPVPDQALKIQNAGKPNERIVQIKTYTQDQFIQRAENRKALNEALLGFTMAVAGAAAELAAGPAYTSSYVTYHTGYSSGLVSYRSYSYHPGLTYFLAAGTASQAGIALQNYAGKAARGIQNITEEYLSEMTVNPYEQVSGYVFLQNKEVSDKIIMTLKVNHIPYTFEFTPSVLANSYPDFKIYR